MMGWRGLVKAIILLCAVSLVLQAVEAKEEPAELKNETVKIQDIIMNESAYDGKMVVIEGKIETECGSGCWFTVDDGTASIYVDIKPNNFVIPQKRGSNVKVYGKATTKEGDPEIIGKIVEIGGEIYR